MIVAGIPTAQQYGRPHKPFCQSGVWEKASGGGLIPSLSSARTVTSSALGPSNGGQTKSLSVSCAANEALVGCFGSTRQMAIIDYSTSTSGRTCTYTAQCMNIDGCTGSMYVYASCIK